MESSGEFTVSREHARKKLEQFTLPEPRLYVLSMVSGAVCGGASFIEFRADADELWMETDARLEDPQELEVFESVLFSNRTGSPLREILIGMCGLLALKLRRVELDVSDSAGVSRLAWDGQQYRYEKVSDGPVEPGIKLYVQERLGLRTARKLAASVGGGMLPDSEEDAIFRYCNRCPIRISYNGKTANRPVILGQANSITFADRPFPPGHALAPFGPPGPAEAGISGLLTAEGRLAPWVTLVVQGVNFRLPEEAFSIPGLRGIVYSDALRKDLSQVQLVQDATFRAVVAEIGRQAERLLTPAEAWD